MRYLRRIAVLFILGNITVSAADWPAYRKDAARSGITSEALNFPLGNAWEYRLQLQPQEAWPDAGRSFSVYDFDVAPIPVAADGVVYLPGSADDTLYAINAGTGSEIWRYTAGAPIRFAPHIAHGRCYFSADDGMVYSLDAHTGAVVWKKQIAPNSRMLPGNDRMISRWPSRSGVLVNGDILYTVAGMWPSEGVNIYALDASTGDRIWLNDTVNALYLPYPHDGLSLGGPTSQGYLASNGEVLVMPVGEGGPARFDARTGAFLHWEARAGGSWWVTLIDNYVVTAARGWQADIPLVIGEGEPFEGDELRFYSLDGEGYGKWRGYDNLPGSRREGRGRYRGQRGLIGGRVRAVYTGDRFFAYGMGELEGIDSSGTRLERLWIKNHKRVHSMAVADGVLIVGSEGFVAAINPETGEEIWRGSVDGQARGLAIAGGTLYASTNRGTLFAFAPGHELREARILTSQVPEMPRGFGLVIGSSDTELAERLASERRLNVITLIASEDEVGKARTRLVEQGKYGGRHVVVHTVPEDGVLPYSDYFASEIVIAEHDMGIEPSEIYRVLTPYTGRIRFENMSDASIEAFLSAAGIPDNEINGHIVSRGGLEGAFDWNSDVAVDYRVSWPLEMLWFGGPGRQRTLSRHRMYRPPPVPAAGITYKIDDDYVTAVDSYTGIELWSYNAPGYRYMSADDRFAYIATGGRVMTVDSRSGKLMKIYGIARPFVYSLEQRQEFSIENESGDYGGTIGISLSENAVKVDLTVTNPEQDFKDAWMLWFDFRPLEERLLPGGTGKFPVIVNIKHGTLRRFDGYKKTSVPAMELKETEEGFTLIIPFREIHQLFEHDPLVSGVATRAWIPDSFDLTAVLELWSQDFPAYPTRHLSGAPITKRNDPWRNGTATFVVRGEADDFASPFALVEYAYRNQMPPIAGDWGRVPRHLRHDGNRPRPPLVAEGKEELLERECPITGITGDLFYLRGYGCGGTVASATMNLFRSGTVGLYDLADDSGMRNIAGTRPGCRITLSPAHGVLVSLEGAADCFCPYNFATSLALAPASVRSNEDWAVFKDNERIGVMRQLGINFGAPGDRRDDAGLLWLGFPRERMMYATGGAFGARPNTISLPLALDIAEGGGPYRVNADRVLIENTERPWITASGVEGIRSLDLSLTNYEPMYTAMSIPVSDAPRIDGELDAAWSGNPGIPISNNPGALQHPNRVRVCHDQDMMYLAFIRLADIDRRGVPRPWAEDTHFNVFLKDSERPVYIQLQVMLDGAMRSRAICVQGEMHEVPPATWRSGVQVTDEEFSVEVAIPLALLAELGMAMDNLLAQFDARGDLTTDLEEMERRFQRGFVRIRCKDAPEEAMNYILTLHFAEIDDDVQPGERVFDIRINGETVARGVDTIAEAGAHKRAVSRDFSISADRDLRIEFIPQTNKEPILSGLELLSEVIAR